jgi:hypothetical protein
MSKKPKNPQRESVDEVDGRDTFQTPNYATDLIVPYLKRLAFGDSSFLIWECAAGLGKMVRRLRSHGFRVIGTDLADPDRPFNFLTDEMNAPFNCIVTNTPFSIKRKFFLRCLHYGQPFALLLPADYSGWLIEAVDRYGCEKIIPKRRIDYVTPNVLQRIHEGEVWENSKEWLTKWPLFEGVKTLAEFRERDYSGVWQAELDKFPGYCKWDSIFDVPPALLAKYSSSYFHSMWLTRGFGIGRSETFVDLSNEEKVKNV